MVKRFDWLLVCLLFSIGVMAQSGGKQYNSYKGLVMAGYQGWFNTPGDGSGRGWHHYNGRNGFRPGSCSVDLWPEVSEYKKLYKTEFSFADGKLMFFLLMMNLRLMYILNGCRSMDWTEYLCSVLLRRYGTKAD